jgi:hypothetical protein
MWEVEEAIKKGHVRDPISGILVSMAISAAFTGASMLAARIFAPKQPPLQQGALTGEVSGLMQSSAGQLIPEIFGGDPGDGKGGVKIPAFILWASKLRKTVTESTQPSGGKGLFGGGPGQTVQNISYDLDFAAMGPRGPAVLKREWGNTDKILDLDTRGFYEGEDAANTFTSPYVISSFTAASGGQDVTLQGSAGATASVTFNAVVSNGAATRDLTIDYVNTATFTAELTINGVSQTITFPNSSNQYSSIVVPDISLNDGNNTIKIRNSITTPPYYNLRIDRIFWFPGFSDSTRSTGIVDPTYPADPTYDPSAPPDPTLPDLHPVNRYNLAPSADSYGVSTGQTLQGGYADYAIYPGNWAQLQDPTIQADVDGRLGANSTPAYRGRGYIRHSSFKLDRWQGVMPNVTQLWEHATCKTLGQIFAQWCDRVGMLTSDYDFTAVAPTAVRGLLVSGRLYAPSEVMRYCEDVYDVFITETDGQVQAIANASAPTITIPESEIGWTEDDQGASSGGAIDTFPQLTSHLAYEATLPRRVDVRFIDPDKEYETNTAAASRADTEGQTNVILDLAFTLTQTESASLATRKLFRDYLRGTTHQFSLPWKYLFLYAGYIINTTRNGIPLAIQLSTIKGGISTLDCEGWTADTAISDQNATTSGGQGGIFPNVGVISSAVAAFMDVPLLRDGDVTINNATGFYVAATPKTTSGQLWPGASLFINKAGYNRLATFRLPATMGRQVLANGGPEPLPPVTDLTVWDNLNIFTVDLYGTTAALTSATTDDVLNGANAALLGSEVIQFTTATRVAGYPNRWVLSGLRRGLRGTENAVSTHALNENFVILNEAVQFVPMDIADLNLPYQYKMVTAGQAIADAATIGDGVTSWIWTGAGLMPRKVLSLTAIQNASGDWLISVEGNPRPSEEPADYAAEFWLDQTRGDVSNRKGVLALHPGSSHAAMLEGSDYISDVVVVDNIATLTQRTWGDQNNIYGPDQHGLEFVLASARTAEQVTETGTVIDLTYHGCQTIENVTGRGQAIFGIGDASLAPDSVFSDWRLSFSVIKNPGFEALFIQEYGVLKKALSGPLDYEMRFTIMLSGGEIRVYKNRKGINDEPLWVTTLAPATLPLRAFFQSAWKAAITGVTIYSNKAEAVYSVRDQIRDFGSVQNRLFVRAAQVSSYPGINGIPLNLVLPPF